jgi:hypothetical protein
MNTIYTDVYKMTTLLADRAVCYRLTKEDPFEERKTELHTVNFIPESRYSTRTFYGIMPDSGAAGVSTAGHPQFQALRREIPAAILDQASAGKATIRFGGGNALESIGYTKLAAGTIYQRQHRNDLGERMGVTEGLAVAKESNDETGLATKRKTASVGILWRRILRPENTV